MVAFGFVYEKIDKKIIIKGIPKNRERSLVLIIPSFIDGKPVTSIEKNAFALNKHIKNVVLPETLVSIGDNAFYQCRKLESLVLPSSVVSIGMESFYNCVNLKYVVLSSSIKLIGKSAFDTCISLSDVIVRSETPPEQHISFYLNTTDRKFYVPNVSLELYKKKWKSYANHIVPQY